MKFYHLKCEVPGGLGPETIYDKHVTPWEMRHPHIIFDGWLGGELLTVASCLLVSDNLMKNVMFDYSGINGCETFQLNLSKSFTTLQPNSNLPKFKWMKVGDNPFRDDVALTFYNNMYNQLIVSDNFWKVLSKFELGNYQIEEAERNSEIT